MLGSLLKQLAVRLKESPQEISRAYDERMPLRGRGRKLRLFEKCYGIPVPKGARSYASRVETDALQSTGVSSSIW